MILIFFVSRCPFPYSIDSSFSLIEFIWACNRFHDLYMVAKAWLYSNMADALIVSVGCLCKSHVIENEELCHVASVATLVLILE